MLTFRSTTVSGTPFTPVSSVAEYRGTLRIRTHQHSPFPVSGFSQCQARYGSLRATWVVLNRAGVGILAKVAELADAPDLGSGGRKAVGVQIPPFAPRSDRSDLKRPIEII